MNLSTSQRRALRALVDVPGKGWLSTSATAWFRLDQEEYDALTTSPLIELGFDRGGNARVRLTEAGRTFVVNAMAEAGARISLDRIAAIRAGES